MTSNTSSCIRRKAKPRPTDISVQIVEPEHPLSPCVQAVMRRCRVNPTVAALIVDLAGLGREEVRP